MPEPQHATITATFEMVAKLVPHLEAKLREVERDIRCELVEVRIETDPVPIPILEVPVHVEQTLQQADEPRQSVEQSGAGTEGDGQSAEPVDAGEDSGVGSSSGEDRAEPLGGDHQGEGVSEISGDVVEPTAISGARESLSG